MSSGGSIFSTRSGSGLEFEVASELREFGVAAVVSGFGDQVLGLAEVVQGCRCVGREEVPCHREVVIGKVESHAGVAQRDGGTPRRGSDG